MVASGEGVLSMRHPRFICTPDATSSRLCNFKYFLFLLIRARRTNQISMVINERMEV